MHRLQTLIARSCKLLVVLFSCSFLFGCSATERLTEQEKAKIHPQLQRILEGEQLAGLDDFSSLRRDGSREYPLVVHMTKPEELASIGITPQSRFGEILTVRATKEEIVRIARLSSVSSIDPGTRNDPNNSIH